MLVKFKDDPSTLGTILEKLLDKTIAPNLKSASVFGERRATSPLPVNASTGNGDGSNALGLVPRQIRSQSSADEGSVGYRDTHGRRKSHSRTSPCHRLRKNRGTYHCSVNSSASEEAMLSDEDGRQGSKYFSNTRITLISIGQPITTLILIANHRFRILIEGSCVPPSPPSTANRPQFRRRASRTLQAIRKMSSSAWVETKLPECQMVAGAMAVNSDSHCRFRQYRPARPVQTNSFSSGFEIICSHS